MLLPLAMMERQRLLLLLRLAHLPLLQTTRKHDGLRHQNYLIFIYSIPLILWSTGCLFARPLLMRSGRFYIA